MKDNSRIIGNEIVSTYDLRSQRSNLQGRDILIRQTSKLLGQTQQNLNNSRIGTQANHNEEDYNELKVSGDQTENLFQFNDGTQENEAQMHAVETPTISENGGGL